MTEQTDKSPLVRVFETADQALLPLALTTLEQAGIDYGFRPAEGQFPVVFGHPAAFIEAEGAVEIVVRAADADRARDLLADLERAGGQGAGSTAPAAVPATGRAQSGPRTITLIDRAGFGGAIGKITEEQLRLLVGQLEDATPDDPDYYIDGATIDLLARAGADAEFVDLLRRALGSRDGVELGWAREADQTD